MPIEKSGEKFEVYGYWVKKDPPKILERSTYSATYGIPTNGIILLACHNGLGRKNHGNLSLLTHFMMIEAG